MPFGLPRSDFVNGFGGCQGSGEHEPPRQGGGVWGRQQEAPDLCIVTGNPINVDRGAFIDFVKDLPAKNSVFVIRNLNVYICNLTTAGYGVELE